MVCRPGEEPVLERGLNCSGGQVGIRESSGPVIPRILQPVVSGPKTQQQMKTHFGPQSIKSVSGPRHFQDGNSRDHLVVLAKKGERVMSLDFSDAYFHIPINHRSRKYLRFYLHNQMYQFTTLPFGLDTAPLEFTKVVKEVKLMAQTRGIRIHQHQMTGYSEPHARKFVDIIPRPSWPCAAT